MSDAYDSGPETRKHIRRVQDLLNISAANLRERGRVHDQSKLVAPEKEAFDRGTPALKGLTYDSPEYWAAFAMYGMEEGLRHHYANNRHHPEATVFENGEVNKALVAAGAAISRMSLFDILEMLMDWKAASERHADGDIMQSLVKNRKRFGISEQLQSILLATAAEMDWT